MEDPSTWSQEFDEDTEFVDAADLLDEEPTINSKIGGKETVKHGVVTVENLKLNKVIKPGRSVTLGFIGKGGGTPEPLLFFLNNGVCTSR